jgi:hypothetical protein
MKFKRPNIVNGSGLLTSNPDVFVVTLSSYRQILVQYFKAGHGRPPHHKLLKQPIESHSMLNIHSGRNTVMKSPDKQIQRIKVLIARHWEVLLFDTQPQRAWHGVKTAPLAKHDGGGVCVCVCVCVCVRVCDGTRSAL